MKITTAQIKGPRTYQEDRYKVINDSNGDTLLAVFDGHGGADTADKAAENVELFYHYVRDARNYNDISEEVIADIFAKLHALTKNDDTGSTASLVLIEPKKQTATVGTLGDSPVYIINSNGNLYNNPEHNVRTNIVEAHSATARGGNIYGGYLYKSYRGQGLQMSRALGDVDLQPVVDHIPEIHTVEINDQSKIVVASDGFGDPSHATDRTSFKKELQFLLAYGVEADALMHWVKNPQDNVTIIVAG